MRAPGSRIARSLFAPGGDGLRSMAEVALQSDEAGERSDRVCLVALRDTFKRSTLNSDVDPEIPHRAVKVRTWRVTSSAYRIGSGLGNSRIQTIWNFFYL